MGGHFIHMRTVSQFYEGAIIQEGSALMEYKSWDASVLLDQCTCSTPTLETEAVALGINKVGCFDYSVDF